MKRELTKQLESATRKRIDENLKNLNWCIDEFKKDCNVYTGRTRTKEETSKIKAIFPKGKYPDYVLYSSDDYKPIAIIEAKRPGQNIDKAIKQAIDYANCLEIKIVFAIDGAIIESREVKTNNSLKLDGLLITELINEKLLLRFVNEGSDIYSPQNIVHRQFNNEVQHLGEQKGKCYLKCLWENDIII